MGKQISEIIHELKSNKEREENRKKKDDPIKPGGIIECFMGFTIPHYIMSKLSKGSVCVTIDKKLYELTLKEKTFS